MRKLLCAVLIVILLVGLVCCKASTSTANNCTVEKIHVNTSEFIGCFTITRWTESTTGETYVLIRDVDDCPLCAAIRSDE